jgi:hypothetical protein
MPHCAVLTLLPGTDGFWDNLWPADVTQLVGNAAAAGYDAEGIAKLLRSAACANRRSTTALVPFYLYEALSK